MQRHTSLEVLDLSRNAISSLGSGTFLGLRALRVLDLGVNALRAVEDDAFEGLSALSSLSLRDNNALLVPSSALGRLPLLVHLRLDFNRVAAVSSDLLPDIAPALRSLDLSHNVVRELPPDAFRRFSSLRWLSLSGNRLSALEEASLAGLERALESLSLDYNRLQRLPALRLPRLETLSAAHNRLVSFPDLTFLPHLRHLSLANNPQAGAALSPLALPPALVSLDLSSTGLSSPPVFPPPNALRSLNLNRNSLSQLRDDAFLALSSLRHLDLSHNSIADIRDFAFRGLSSLRNLSLAFNLLSSVQEGLLDHSPLIEALDLSNNRLSLLLPSVLAPLTRLRILRLSSNPLSALPPDLFRGLPLLQRVDLSSNHLSAVGAGAFADLPLLRHLSLASNRISTLDEGAFSRSPQLRFLNLSDNALERLSGRTFEGLSSLEVDLSRNRLSALPDALFDSSRVRSLRSVDLSSNLFFSAPLSSLHSQHSSLEHLSLANNSLEHLPRGDLLLHLKSFDLSSNALSSEVLSHVLSEPKTTRALFLSATGLRQLPPLETPFLRVLDLSRNAISEIPPTTFDRTTSLRKLDLSYNALLQISDSLRRVWRVLPFLRHLDLSGNPIAEIGKEDLEGLEDLSTFRLTRMPFLRTMHADAFHNISRLESLSLHGLPLLGYLEAAGLLRSAPHSLRALDVEPSESVLAEGLSVPLRHRLRRLALWGNRLQGLAPGSLAGLSAPDLEIRLLDTQVTSIPPTLFFPLPKSSKIILDISGAKMTSVPSSLLASFDSRKETLEVRGLQWNPISCDCSARSLRRWLLLRRLSDGAVCASPPSLSGRRLPDKVSEEDLGCERRSTDAVSTSTAKPTSAEPEIIWSLPPAPSPAPNLREEKPERPAANDDALVVGVVGGVVAFIALLAAGICVARVRLSAGGRYRGGPLAAGQRTPAGMECACRPASKPMPPLYVNRTPYLVAMDSDRCVNNILLLFSGAENLEHLDLSDNVMSEIPSIALDSLPYLKILNLSSNSIQSVQNKDLQRHTSLEVLDLSRNAISSLGSGTFLGLRALRVLDLGVNALRAVEDDAFEGLSALSSLSLRDNNALLVPSSALGRLPLLVHLRLDFNRVAAVSSDLLPDIAPALRSLDLSHNVVRELPPDAFRRFSSLRWLSLSGNRLSALEEASLAGLERALESLSLDYNRLQRLPALRLPRLETLSAAHNRLVSFPDLTFLPHLRHLSLANNPQAGAALSPLALPPALVSLDLSSTGLSSPPVFPPPNALRSLNLNRNSLSQLRDDAFLALSSLRHLDLSHNSIADIRDFAFRGLSSLRNLSLAFNLLSSVQEGLLDHSPLIEALDLSNNRLSLLLPSVLAPLTRLRILRLSSNPLSALPPDLFRGLPLLQRVDLSSNHLSAVGAGAFADLPLLRHLSLASNRISTLDEGAFSRSPQLRFLNLSDNALERLSGRTFEGLSSLEVDLSRNRLSALPDALFDSSRVRSLRSVDLSSNLFFSAPLSSLHSQHSSLEHLSLANNSLEHLPRGDLLLHLKSFDLSSNALSSEVLSHVLSEPKTTRALFLSATGLRQLPPLETPFLRVLDLSRNAISEIPPTTFDRTTSLRKLDLSYNALLQISDSLRRVWRVLPFLRHLDLSGNPIAEIGKEDLEGLEDLSTFRLTRMPFLRTMHADAFHNISRLESLSLHGLPLLGYLEAAGLLRSAPHSLRALDVEPSESVLAEGLSVPLRHRLRRLALWGNRLQGLAPGSLAGLSAPDLEIRLLDTQVTSIPPTLFFPLPKSSKIILDISGAKMTSVPSSLLASFDSRKETLEVRGLQWNPISCDCSARSLRRWLLLRRLSDGAVCASPPSLSGRRLPDKVSEEDLGCERRSTDAVSTSTAKPTSAEPEIIWSLPPAPSPAPNLREEKPERPAANDDALVVGVVGGVVAFIALLAAGICVARVRLSAGGRYRGGPLAAGQRTPAGMECACRPASKPMPPLYVNRTPYLVAMDSDRW
ncbi:hypothetical protein J437_LFUL018463 [Ladona fulva]|uniref:LRRCT domain-containing protein n=1 Tax=Ladona fulva TaxID=123851 RepID=A0A8K0KQA7_LADFU|nr:hypothetical protein J437_LFUL018463 [Ladona fulva]